MGAQFDPCPQLELEYVPGGSLDTCDGISELESTKILCQLSSALEYLHNRNPSITHRDIKPENILVAERTVDNIYVKFSDFGLSKESEVLKTYCGTPIWAAPEILLKRAYRGAAHDTYTPAVDIWSLGAVVASFLCGGLPEWNTNDVAWALTWSYRLRGHYNDFYDRKGGKLLSLVLEIMLQVQPENRSSADDVHDKAEEVLECIAADESEKDTDKSAITPKPCSEPSSLHLTIESGSGHCETLTGSVFQRSGQSSVEGSSIAGGLSSLACHVFQARIALLEESIVDEQLVRPDHHDAANSGDHNKIYNEPRSPRQETAGESQEAEVQVTVEISDERISLRKRKIGDRSSSGDQGRSVSEESRCWKRTKLSTAS